jgi:hypothetical protein
VTLAGSFRNTGCVLNCTMSDVDKLETEAHPDILQQSIRVDNAVYAHILAETDVDAPSRLTSTGGQTCRDVVCEHVEITSLAPYCLEIGNTNRNQFFKDCYWGGHVYVYPDTTTTNVVFEDCTFTGDQPSNTGLTIR